jgi:hypothetical protein
VCRDVAANISGSLLVCVRCTVGYTVSYSYRSY